MGSVIAGNVLAEGLLGDYRDVYMSTRRSLDSRLSLICDLGAFTDGRTNSRAYFEAAPHMRYVPYGDPTPEEGMGSKSFTIYNWQYKARVPWLRADREDDRTGSLPAMAQGAGESGALSPERGVFDMLLSTTSFIPAVPNAADGTTIFSSSTRFETANGNSLTVSNWNASGPAARAGLFTGIEQFHLYKDGKGQPLHTDQVLESPVLCIYAAADMDIMAEALHPGTVAYANSTSNAGVDNVLMAQNRKWIPWASSRLSAGTMILALTGVRVKPLLMQPRSKIRESFATEDNSDEARDSGKEYAQWEQRLGFGAGLPYGLIKISAS